MCVGSREHNPNSPLSSSRGFDSRLKLSDQKPTLLKMTWQFNAPSPSLSQVPQGVPKSLKVCAPRVRKLLRGSARLPASRLRGHCGGVGRFRGLGTWFGNQRLPTQPYLFSPALHRALGLPPLCNLHVCVWVSVVGCVRSLAKRGALSWWVATNGAQHPCA